MLSLVNIYNLYFQLYISTKILKFLKHFFKIEIFYKNIFEI